MRRLILLTSNNLTLTLLLTLTHSEAVMVGEAAMVAPGGVDDYSRWSYYARHE